MDQPLNVTLTAVPNSTKRRSIALILVILSILVNLGWASLPFYAYGLRGRSGLLYGRYTLLQTFSFHPVGWLWWTLVGLQVFAMLVVAANAVGLNRIVRLVCLMVPAIGLLLLDAYIALRWGTLRLWTMYSIGALPGLLLVASGACYTRQ